MHEQVSRKCSPASDDYITLTHAAQSVPGRTTPNCVWRWCRTGVLARNGERVRLEHVRVGGKIYTRHGWLEAFCRRLAELDTAYFDAKATAARQAPPRDPRYASPTRQWRRTRPGAVSEEAKRRLDESRRRHDEAERHLEEEGL